MEDNTKEVVQKVIEYIDNAFNNRPHLSAYWLDENGNSTCVDVGYAEEWWDECMKPEIRRRFGLNV